MKIIDQETQDSIRSHFQCGYYTFTQIQEVYELDQETVMEILKSVIVSGYSANVIDVAILLPRYQTPSKPLEQMTHTELIDHIKTLDAIIDKYKNNGAYGYLTLNWNCR